jgi:acyl-CoA synthetase (NDP forming)
MLRQAGEKGVKAVHLFTGRLSETGTAEGREMENAIADAARKAGVRLIGPNCPGLYYPKERIVTNYDVCVEPGSVGVIFQSGGMSWDFSRYADLRGIRFSKVIAMGNAVDLNESDLLEYMTYDPETKVIAMYIEGVKDGPRFFRALKEATARKPVIILKGGKSAAGTKRTVSHTSAIAGSFNTWEVLFRQCNVVQAKDFTDLLDMTAAFNLLPPIMGKRAGVIGGGGGISVLSADECEKAGLEMPELPDEIQDFIREVAPELSGWMSNPVDFSLPPGTKLSPHDLLRKMTETPAFDFLICKLTEDLPLAIDGYEKWLMGEVDIYIDVSKKKQKPFTVSVGNPLMGAEPLDDKRWRTLFEIRSRLIENGIPFFANNNVAANAISRVADYYMRREELKS